MHHNTYLVNILFNIILILPIFLISNNLFSKIPNSVDEQLGEIILLKINLIYKLQF